MIRRPIVVSLIIWVIISMIIINRDDESDKIIKTNLTIKAEVCDISGAYDDVRLTVRDIYTSDGRYISGQIMVYPAKDYHSSKNRVYLSDVKIGEILTMAGEIIPFKKPGNPGQFNEYDYYHSTGVVAKYYISSYEIEDASYDHIKDFLYRIRVSMTDSLYKALPEDEAGIASAMLLGERTGLSDDVKKLYRENGIAHILAISGLHISIIGIGLFYMLRRYIMPMRMAAVITMMVMFMYALLTGFSISARRAVIMMLIMLMARVLGRRYDGLNSLSLSALIQLMIEPLVLLQSAFLLSYGTVAGIIIMHNGVKTHKKSDDNGGFIHYIYTTLYASGEVFMITLPIIIQSYHEVSILSIPVNALLLPFMGMLIGLITLCAVTMGIYDVLGYFFAGGAHIILKVYDIVCNMTVMFTHHMFIAGELSIIQIVIYYISLFIFTYNKNRLIKTVSFIMLIITITFPTSLFLPYISVTNLDIGQGDSAVVRIGDATILIDGGSSDVKEVGKYRIVPYLKYMGIDRIDYMFITHSDSDHISGLFEMVSENDHFGIDIDNIILPDISDKDDNYKNFESKAISSGISIGYMDKGDTLYIGEGEIRCVHPYKGLDQKGDANAYSMVLCLSYKDFDAIFTGDIADDNERMILDDIGDVEYLKVAHHGSKYSSCDEFLSVIEPQIAVISAGEDNRYGHPAKETIERLISHGAKIYTTIESGAVTTTYDGEKISVDTFK